MCGGFIGEKDIRKTYEGDICLHPGKSLCTYTPVYMRNIQKNTYSELPDKIQGVQLNLNFR